MESIIQNITQQLIERDERESHRFEPLANAFHTLYQQHALAKKRLNENDIEIQQFKEESISMKQELEQWRIQGNPDTVKRLNEVEIEKAKMEEELRNLYKTQTQQSQRLMDTTDALNDAQQTITKLRDELLLSAQNATQLQSKIDALNLNIQEKNGVIQVLQDEMRALQLELDQSARKLKALQEEYQNLLQRWLDKMNQEAQQLNTMNERRQSKDSLEEAIEVIDKGELLRDTHFTPVVLPTTIRKSLLIHDGEVHGLCMSHDDGFIATCSADRTIRLHDARTGAASGIIFQGSQQALLSCDWSHDDGMILGAGNDQTIRVWAVSTGRVRHTLTGHMGKVMSAKFSNDSQHILSGSHDRSVKYWDLQRGYCVRTMMIPSSCNDVVFLSDLAGTMASAHFDGSVRLYDFRLGKPIQELLSYHQDSVTGIHINPRDSRQLLSCGRDNCLRLLDTRTFRTLNTFTADSFRVQLHWCRPHFSTDGVYTVCGGQDGGLYFWNTINGELVQTLKEHVAPVCGVQWGYHGGGHLVSVDKDRRLIIWQSPFHFQSPIMATAAEAIAVDKNRLTVPEQYKDDPDFHPVMHLSPDEMRKHRLPHYARDYCAHLLVPLNQCRSRDLHLPWRCGTERHAYEQCLHEDYKRRVRVAEKLAKIKQNKSE